MLLFCVVVDRGVVVVVVVVVGGGGGGGSGCHGRFIAKEQRQIAQFLDGVELLNEFSII